MIHRIGLPLLAGFLVACSNNSSLCRATPLNANDIASEHHSAVSIASSSLSILYWWALEQKLPGTPLWEESHSFRVVPWKNLPETRYTIRDNSVVIYAPGRSIWAELRAIVAEYPTLTDELVLSEIQISEAVFSEEHCAEIPQAIEGIKVAYYAPVPERLSVYVDGPRYTAGQRQFGGDLEIREAHEEHPVIAAWLLLVEKLNECGVEAPWQSRPQKPNKSLKYVPGLSALHRTRQSRAA